MTNHLIRKHKFGSLLSVILLLGVSSLADACWYNGFNYPEGTVVAGLVCNADGSWKPE